MPGRYYFFCRINPGRMNGTIVVNEGGQPGRAVSIQAVDPARPGEVLSFDPSELTIRAGTACEVHPEAMKGVLTVTGEARAGPTAASAAPREASINIVDFGFEPKEASVAPGGTVTWRNTGNAPHTATFDDVDIDTGTLEPGKDGALVAPAQPGSYSYRCNIHPAKMRAALVVVGQNVADPTKTQVDKPAEATSGGPGGGVSALALATGVGGAFLGGFGVSAFARNKMGAG